MEDNNIYFLGGEPKKPDNDGRKHRIVRRTVVVIVVLAAIYVLFFMFGTPGSSNEQHIEGDEMMSFSVSPGPFDDERERSPLSLWVESSAIADSAAVSVLDTMVNDIPVLVFYPQNMVPYLSVGYDVTLDTVRNLMFMQAADVRADNKKILGAFVLKGEPLSWGLSKKGYCSIINGEVTVGVADDSPLFEEATDKGGYFFRQYALVDSFRMVENQLKNKSIRRAICDIDGSVVVVETQSRESMHDFAEALADMGICNAVNLVGSSSIGWVKGEGKSYVRGHHNQHRFKNVSFIVWSK